MGAFRNIASDFAYQFRLKGSLPARLACLLVYNAAYVASRLNGAAQGDSRLRALGAVGRLGFSKRPAFIRTAEGLSFELDVLAACHLVKEVLHDLTYEHDPSFRPRPGWTVVDVGAHQGLFTVHAAREVGPGGKVISFEAFPGNAERLRRNVASNGLRNVTVIGAAAAEKEGRAELHLTPLVSGGQSLVFDNAAYHGTITVPLKTVDGVLAELGAGRVDLVKIDVEGAAQRVLDGAPRLLAAKPRLVMEIEGADAELAAMRSRLEGLGYRVEAVSNILYATPG
jgi:FkbM family methyltransferase